MAEALVRGGATGADFGGHSCGCEVEAPDPGIVYGDTFFVHDRNGDDGSPLGRPDARGRRAATGPIGEGFAELYRRIAAKILDPLWGRGNFGVRPIERQIVVRRARVHTKRRRIRADWLVAAIDRLHPVYPLSRLAVSLHQERSSVRIRSEPSRNGVPRNFHPHHVVYLKVFRLAAFFDQRRILGVVPNLVPFRDLVSKIRSDSGNGFAAFDLYVLVIHPNRPYLPERPPTASKWSAPQCPPTGRHS